MTLQGNKGTGQSDIDVLEQMLDRMNRDPSPRTSSPVLPPFPPPRTSSRASSRTRLSTHSSSRSLQSMNSLSPRPSSPLSARPNPDRLQDEAEDDTTPSMRQGEWGRQAFNHARARTTSDNRGLQRNYDDDTNSLRSTRSRGPDDDTTSSTSLYPSSSSVNPPRWSPHASPPSRPRQLPSNSPTPSNPFSSSIGQSPLRLLPRSPLNDRAPLDDLAFLREAGAFADDDQLSVSYGNRTLGDTDTASINSANSASLRNARLREDIEKTAQRIKERESTEEARAGTSTPPVTDATPSGSRRPSAGFASSLPLYPGAPLPAAPLASPPYEAFDSFDARSLHSIASGADSTASFAGTWPAPSNSSGTGGGARAEYSAPKGERQGRVRQKESKEWSQACWIWVKDKTVAASSSSSGVGKFSKTPLIQNVPSVMKRKTGKRESAHHLLSPAEAMLFNFDDPSSSSSKSSKSSSSKDKVKEKARTLAGPIAAEREGSWRRTTGVLRDDGYFRVFGESDKIVIHSIHLPSYNRTDVRLVDHSLFGRPNCVSISHRTASPVTPHRSSFASSPMSSSLSSGSPRSLLEEPVYLCFPSVVATQVWLVMAHCFARPEYYLASGAATPRQMTAKRTRDPSWPSSDESSSVEDGTDELEKSCRIYRKLYLTVNEGRALGETMTESTRPGAKSSWDRPGMSREGSNTGDTSGGGGGNELMSPTSLDSPSKSIASALPQPRTRQSDESSGTGSYCEVEMDGEVVARTAVRKGGSPFWNESFTFSDLPPFTSPITIRVLQSSKGSSRVHVLGTATVRVPDLPRHELFEDWWSVKPANSAKAADVVGELNLGIRVGEEIVLPSREYEGILKLLTDDPDADLAADIAHEFPSELEELTNILLRIYQAESLLVPRLLRLADLEVDNNNRLNRTSAILFRGNTILTKSVELYLRLIGAEYLEASIGETIRKIIKDKVEIEIDPMKLKSGWKDKELVSNIHALHEWTTTLWNSIYDARERCPQDLRQIFGHIQRIVVDKYGQGEDQKNTRWTSVSAFIFLRFFVPAVLNPRLFFIVSNPPDAKSQRTLTLIAKTLQGLANFSSFGQKEPWMLPMNSFVQDNGAAFVDFIEHVATPAPATAYRQEWTSALASTYLAPYRLRNSLNPLAKEGVALLPHLIDLPRELGLLATHLARWTAEKATHDRDGSVGTGRSETPSVASTRGGGSQRFVDLAEACAEAYDESRRRGGGLVSALTYYDLRLKQPELRTRVGSRMTGRPATSSGSYGSGFRERGKASSATAPLSRPSTASTTEELLHIRNPLRPTTPPPQVASTATTQSTTRSDSDEPNVRNSTASRRSHRSFTINGSSPGRSITSDGVLKSLSNEDLALLASIQTKPSIGYNGDTSTNLGSTVLDRIKTTADDVKAGPCIEDDTLFDLQDDSSNTDYSFPPSLIARGTSSPTISSVAMNKTSSTHSSSTASTASRSHRLPPTNRIRITQETTTSTVHVSQLHSPSSSLLGNSVSVSAAHNDENLAMSPVSPTSPSHNGTPYESEFRGLPFVAPARSVAPSAISSPIVASRSGGGLPSSSSSMSISAEVSAATVPTGRRASSAGIMAGFGLGKSSRYGYGGGGDDETSSSSSGGKGAGGLLSRAMGRKGSRAS